MDQKLHSVDENASRKQGAQRTEWDHYDQDSQNNQFRLFFELIDVGCIVLRNLVKDWPLKRCSQANMDIASKTFKEFCPPEDDMKILYDWLVTH